MTPIQVWCRHCGGQLAAEWSYNNSSFTIDGARAVTVVHARTNRPDCTVVRHSPDFDIWHVNKELAKEEAPDAR